MAGPLLISLWARSGEADPTPYAVHMPPGENAWHGPLPVADATWRPVFVGAHSEQHVTYEDFAGHMVEAVAVGYAVQQQGRELVNEGNSLLGQGGLSALSLAFVEVGENTYREVVAVDPEGNRSVIWSFYDIEGESFVVPIVSQLWYGIRALTSRPDSELFAFRTACAPSCAEARGVLVSFLHGMEPGLRGDAWRAARDSKNGTRTMKFQSEPNGLEEPFLRRTLLTRPSDGPWRGMQL